jgi:hypothetical protein
MSPAFRIVISDAKPDDTSLEVLTNKRIKGLDSVGLPVEESEPTTLSGLPAHTLKSEVGHEPAKNVWTLYDGKVYQIIFMDHSYEYENLLPTFQQMTESFQIMNQTLGQEVDVRGEDQANEDGETEDDLLFS